MPAFRDTIVEAMFNAAVEELNRQAHPANERLTCSRTGGLTFQVNGELNLRKLIDAALTADKHHLLWRFEVDIDGERRKSIELPSPPPPLHGDDAGPGQAVAAVKKSNG